LSEVGDFLEVKHPIIHLKNDYGYAIWFYDFKQQIVSIDDYYCNHPRWVTATWTKEEMIKIVQKMINEDKEVVKIRRGL